MNKCKFSVVTLSETWLKNNKIQLEYVQIDSYKSEFKNRESKSRGRFGFYIKEYMSFNVWHDLGKLTNRLRFSGLRFKVEMKTNWLL